MSIKQNLNSIKNALPHGVTLVAVSKTKSNKEILEAYSAGHRDFGENKIQEMHEKWEVLPKDIRWHMIGHVQRNKVKYIAPYVALIHGVDSLKLLREINKRGAAHNKVIPCLLQIHIAKEESKFGFDRDELQATISDEAFLNMRNVSIKGLMGMATFTDNKQQVREEFRYLNSIYEQCRHLLPDMHELSMGMSGDYSIAIEEGSTMVRIGSSIFGPRNYT
jgi:pyridoxal phosphate enzyme (YggS family)